MNDPQRPFRRLHLKLSRVIDRVGSVFLLAFLVLWTILLLFMDGCAVWLLAKNVSAMSYPSVVGEITSSEPVDAKTTSRQAVEFRYSVNGQEFTGNRRSFVDANFSGQKSEPKLLAEQFPVGRSIDVFYNPTDPSDSALDRSLSGLPFLIGLFVVPFNALMVGGWNWVARRVHRIQSVPVLRDGTRWLVLTTNGQPLVVMLIVAGSLSFAATFVVVFSGSEENLLLLASIWCGLIGISIGAYWHTRSLIRRERPVLILDDELASVTWPESNDSPAFSVPRSDLLGVELVDQPVNADELGLSPDHVVRLLFKSDAEQPQKRTVLCTPSAVEAIALAEWLQWWIERPRTNCSN